MREESAIQKQVITYLRSMCPEVFVAASMNGMPVFAKNAAIYISHQKALGLKVGDPDIRLHWINKSNPNSPHTLFVEFKSSKGKVSENQAITMAELTRLGFPCKIVRSLDEFIALTKIHNISTRSYT